VAVCIGDASLAVAAGNVDATTVSDGWKVKSKRKGS
jgi:hypothetical protein